MPFTAHPAATPAPGGPRASAPESWKQGPVAAKLRGLLRPGCVGYQTAERAPAPSMLRDKPELSHPDQGAGRCFTDRKCQSAATTGNHCENHHTSEDAKTWLQGLISTPYFAVAVIGHP